MKISQKIGILLIGIYVVVGVMRSDVYSMRAEIALIVSFLFWQRCEWIRRYRNQVFSILLLTWLFFLVIYQLPPQEAWGRVISASGENSFRLYGLTSNPNHEAFLILLAMVGVNASWRILFFAPLILTFSRGGILLGVLIMVAIPVLVNRVWATKYLHHMALWLVVLLWIGLGVRGDWESFAIRLGLIRGEQNQSILFNQSENIRLNLGSWTIEQIKIHPWLGFGPRSFNEQWVKSSPFYNSEKTWLPWTPHNGFLWITHSQGLLGLLVFGLGVFLVFQNPYFLWIFGLHSIVDAVCSNWRVMFLIPMFYLFLSKRQNDLKILNSLLVCLVLGGGASLILLAENYSFYDESLLRQWMIGYFTHDPGHMDYVANILAVFSNMDVETYRWLSWSVLLVALGFLKTQLRFLVLASPLFLIQLITLRPYGIALIFAILGARLWSWFWIPANLMLPSSAIAGFFWFKKVNKKVLFLGIAIFVWFIFVKASEYPFWQGNIAPWLSFSVLQSFGLWGFGGFLIVSAVFPVAVFERTAMLILPFQNRHFRLAVIGAITMWMWFLYTKVPRGKMVFPAQNCWVENRSMEAYFRQNSWGSLGYVSEELKLIEQIPETVSCVYRSNFGRLSDEVLQKSGFKFRDRMYLFDVTLERWEKSRER